MVRLYQVMLDQINYFKNIMLGQIRIGQKKLEWDRLRWDWLIKDRLD